MALRGEEKHRSSFCFFPLVTVLVLLGSSVQAEDGGEGMREKQEGNDMVWFIPETLLKVREDTTRQVTWLTNVTARVERVFATMEKSREAEVAGFSEAFMGAPDLEELDANTTMLDLSNVTYHGFVNVTAKFVGYNTLVVTLYDELNETVATGKMDMTVSLKTAKLTSAFSYVSAFLIASAYFFMGATIDLEIVKGIIKRPVGPCVGVFCQYIMMPLLSFGVGLALYPGDDFDNRLMRLGMFLGGCCPGGGASNMWTHLLRGSLDLSIMMTGVSTFVAFASLPLWVLTLGPVIVNDASFVIPYLDITVTVITLLVPCGLGIGLQIRYPKGKFVDVCAKVLSPIVAFNLIVTFTFGVYAYWYAFTTFTWRTLVAGITLPTLGYLAGMVFALLFRMDTARVIAIAVETGVQNYTIALIILSLTLDSPAGELAVALPAAFTIFTPVPLLVLLIARRAYLWKQERSKVALTTTDLKDLPQKNGTAQLTPHQRNTEKVGGIDNPAANLSDKV
ncbi:ileal sodium/bile acid cotransporter-like isoform X2 [Eriocheir sinensis]|uniref:ileal sodium/bile acid cotransporter-like isoform X2 n=1 Tax=Eriocheir sinensis TaxID=95602 RepID=UPI0021CA331E|nr:ileal sodium/bile acid cotransporter-like isoform X2 [Eriocheir sinensis]